MTVTIRQEPPTAADVIVLLEAHLAFARTVTPPGHVHALDLDALQAPDMTFLTARDHTELLAVGALRQLDATQAEIKSMHTAEAARGRGVGRLMLTELIATAEQRKTTWLGLETGTYEAFEPARRLYASAGFEECPPFSDYFDNEFSVCMAMSLPRDQFGG